MTTLSSMLLVLLTVIGFLPDVDSLECYKMSPTMMLQGQYYECPISSKKCYKFVCNVSNGEGVIYKGCYDSNDANNNCLVQQDLCAAKSGYSQCYTCDGNKCNSAVSNGISVYILGLVCFFKVTLA